MQGSPKGITLRQALRWLAALLFIGAGINHFVFPASYRRIVPPMFPTPDLLVTVSGVCEIAGGMGLLIRPLRRAAGYGLIALLIAVFPANVYMAVAPEKSSSIPPWALWARLPLQPLLMAWVWWVAVRREDRRVDL